MKKDEKKKELNGAVDKKVEKATSLVPKFQSKMGNFLILDFYFIYARILKN